MLFVITLLPHNTWAGNARLAKRLLQTNLQRNFPVPLLSLIYVSSAVRPFSKEQLAALLQTSRCNNVKDGVTGMLLYKGGNFMQAIEGEAETIHRLHGRIHEDPRHHGLLTLLEKTIVKREFPEWSMGFQDLSTPALKNLPGYSEFLDLPLESDTMKTDPSRALKLLRCFRSRM